MRPFRPYFEQPINPIKLADNTVLALASIERGEKASPKFLEGGIKLCDYMIDLLNEPKITEKRALSSAFRSIRDNDKETLEESEIDIQEVQEIKEEMQKILHSKSSLSPERLQYLQRFFIVKTMPMWQKRISEIRDIKLRRRRLILGQLC